MTTFELVRGNSALIVSIPHDGRQVPPDVASRLTPAARVLPDTDWHVRRLYEFVHELDATTLAARYSRYAVDLNRPPDGTPLYPGRWESRLVPVTTFSGDAIYQADPPTPREIERRRGVYWAPYHAALTDEIARVRERHGYALLWDAHSIRSRVPSLFEGRLPELSLGTAEGTACASELGDAVFEVARNAADLCAVRDQRFKGGYITRHYGRPEAGTHAIQLELVQATYMHEEPPYEFDESRAKRIRPVLRHLVEAFLDRARRSAADLQSR